MRTRKSKLCYKLSDLLSKLYENDQNDELSYFILFMDANNLSNFIKFLLDVNNFINLTSSIVTDRSGEAVCPSESSQTCPKRRNYILSTSKVVEQDALSIFKKYICIDAPYSIKTTDDIVETSISMIFF
jgi:hypothetical protein